jgi:hypothetical protein
VTMPVTTPSTLSKLTHTPCKKQDARQDNVSTTFHHHRWTLSPLHHKFTCVAVPWPCENPSKFKNLKTFKTLRLLLHHTRLSLPPDLATTRPCYYPQTLSLPPYLHVCRWSCCRFRPSRPSDLQTLHHHAHNDPSYTLTYRQTPYHPRDLVFDGLHTYLNTIRSG